MNKISYKYLSILLIFLLGFFSVYYSLNFKLDASSDTLILLNDKDFKFFNKYNKIFPNKNFLVLALKSKKIIDHDFINTINRIKEQLIKINLIESILTISDIPILITSDLKLTDLNSEKIKTLNNSDIKLSDVLDEFSKSPIFEDQIISKNKKVSALIIYPKIDENYSNLKKERNKIYEKQRANNTKDYSEQLKNINEKYRIAKTNYNKNRHILINEIRSELNLLNISDEYFLGGIDMIADDTINYVKKDILVFGFSVTFFLIIILFIIFKNIKWVFIPLISTFYSILIMTGIIGLFNWEITAISSNFISLMLILSISMNIHIINRYKINYSDNSQLKSLKITMHEMFYPCLYTSLTTIVAFGSLLFSDIKPVIDFGMVMIVALSIIFITSFSVLPIIISIFPKIDKKFNLNWKFTNLFFLFSSKNGFSIIILNIFLFIISIWGINNLTVENSFINYFKKDSEIHKGMKLIDEELGGTTPLDIIFKFKDNNELEENINNDDLDLDIDLEITDDLFSDLEISNNTVWFNEDKLQIIKEIHNYLENKNEIGKVQSIYSLIEVAEQINKEPLDSFKLNIIYNKIPEKYKDQLISPFLSIDKNMVKINARVLDSKEIVRNQLINDIRNDLSNKYELIEEINVNGLLVLYNNMLQSLFSSQIKSFGIVLLLIFIMFLILFKSLKLSVAGIIPNIFASSFILGLIGILNIPLDIMTITVAAITIGIAVDNSIHYLYNVRKNIYEKRFDIYKSLQNSHNTVGQAVLTTSITIAFGFSVLSLSNFIPTIFFGLFTSLAMVIAMIGVLVTLPAILKYINIRS